MPGKDRPPADTMEDEIFLDRKCAKTDQKLFLWCTNPTGQYKGQCEGITGTTGACDFEAQFTSTANQTTLVYNLTCYYGGPSKPTEYPGERILSPEKFATIKRFCEQEIYGAPWEMPLWLLLLIILAVILLVSLAAWIFWKLWLRKKIYSDGRKSNLSQMTSAPLSSDSSVSSNSSKKRAARAQRHTKKTSLVHNKPKMSHNIHNRGGTQTGPSQQPIHNTLFHASKSPTVRSEHHSKNATS